MSSCVSVFYCVAVCRGLGNFLNRFNSETRGYFGCGYQSTTKELQREQHLDSSKKMCVEENQQIMELLFARIFLDLSSQYGVDIPQLCSSVSHDRPKDNIDNTAYDIPCCVRVM